jgi:hypothetical protein
MRETIRKKVREAPPLSRPHLQHFATKLCNFTNFNMLFVAMVMDFVLLAYLKI